MRVPTVVEMGAGERIYRNVKRNISLFFLGDEDIRGRGKEKLMEEFFIGRLKGCVPERYLGEDVNTDISNKFYALFEGIRKEVERKDPKGSRIRIFLSPSYEAHTDVLLTLGDRVVYEDHIKAWRLGWESKEDMKKDLEEIYREILSRLERVEG